MEVLGPPVAWPSEVISVTRVQRGDQVLARSALGEDVPMRAVSEVEKGDKFPIIWVCPEEEWQSAEAEGREPSADPWPADAVREAVA